MNPSARLRFVLATVILTGCSPLYGPTGDVLAPASADPTSVASAAVGCWELAWVIEAEFGSAPSLATDPLPDSVIFEDSALFGAEGQRLVTPATDPSGRGFDDLKPVDDTPWEQVYRSNRWWTDDERITVVFSDGDERLWSLTLEPADETLAGTGVYRAPTGPDVGSVQAGIRARRIGCPPS